ncbi:MAG: urease subunit alpha [Candidatus Binatia bacterium]
MAKMSRAAYAAFYGPTKGDLVRLGDTSLLAEVEHDYAVYGEECMTGAGKVMRDGMGFHAYTTAAAGGLDMLIHNATIIDPVLGVVKGDIGIRDGKVVAVGKAGNPAIQDGVHPQLICGPSTTIVHGDGLIVTPGAVETHAHFLTPQQCDHALACGITTIIGGSMGPHFDISCAGPTNLATILRAAEQYPLNFGFLGRGSAHNPAAIEESVAGGAIGVKVHEDFGAMAAAIDCALTVADKYDFQVQLHADTINEGGYCEDTLAAIAGRTIHMYHVEGAGGGHAPDIIRTAGIMNCLPASTNPTNPYTPNALDEALPMTMDAHALDWRLPEDVAFAESRIRPQTMAAEDILHDYGAISIFAADTQGMGRIHETITNCWRLASKMKDQRGRLPQEKTARADNERIKRYIAKYTINAARVMGIDHYVGSLEPGKFADLVLWAPAFFGAKPLMTIKGGFVTWAAAGDAAGCVVSTEPVIQRPMWGALGRAPSALSVFFASRLALDADIPRKLGLTKPMLAIRNTRALTKRDMLHNDACPQITVNPHTHEVYADGELLTCEPATVVPLAQRYFLR